MLSQLHPRPVVPRRAPATPFEQALALVAVLCLAGCSNLADEAGGITFESMVVELGGGVINNPNARPLSGVHVCLFEDDRPTEPCTTSGEDGRFTLRGVPMNQRVAISYRYAGLMPSLQPFDTFENDIVLTENVATVLVADSLDQDLGDQFVQDPNLGAVGFFGVTPTGATASVDPVEGYGVRLDPPGPAPIFVGDDNAPDPDLTHSSSVGLGVFQNVEPGTYRMIFSHPEMECLGGIPGLGWAVGNGRTACDDDAPAGAPEVCGHFEVPIVAGWVTTQVGVLCQAR